MALFFTGRGKKILVFFPFLAVLFTVYFGYLFFGGWKNVGQKFVEPDYLKLNQTAPDKYSFKTIGGDIIEIGNNGSGSQPYLKLNKWGGEVSLNINFPNVSQSKASLEGGKLVFSGQNSNPLLPIFASIGLAKADSGTEVVFYPRQPEQISEIDENGNENYFTINEDGGVEFDTILYEKPESNEIFYPMQASGLEFYYQPSLNETEQEEGINCTETVCRDKDGKVVMYRPENVIGSYAVYYEGNKSGDYTQAGGKDYKTGKVFHIYRPSISDASGKKVWGNLMVSENGDKLSIIVPQDFLDSAVYPINIDPIFGYSGIGASNCWLSGNSYRGSRVVTPAGSNGATVSKLSLYSKEDYSGSLNYRSLVADNNKELIFNGISTGALVGSSYAWVDSVFSTPPSVVDNSVYYFGFIADVGSSNLAVACDNSIPEAAYLSDSTNSYASPVDPTDGTVVSTVRYSLYATYSGGTPAVIPGGHYLKYTASSTIAVTHMFDSASTLSPTKVFISYVNNNPGNVVGVVATVSTSSAPVYGTPVAFTTSSVYSQYHGSTALDSSHAFVSYANGSRIATITGTTITYGPEYPFAFGTIGEVNKISSSSALISYEASGYGCFVANVSGNAISYGDPVLFHSGYTNGGKPYDAALLDQTHGIAMYQGDSGSWVKTFEITGTSTISYGPAYKIWDYQIFNASIVPLTATKAMLVYHRSSSGSNGVARIANISGTEINLSVDQIFAPDSEVINSAVALDSNHVFISFSDYENSTYNGNGVVAAVSGNKIYFSSDYTFYPGGYPDWHSAAVLSPTSVFIAYAYSGYLNNGKGIVAYLGDAPNTPTLISPANGSFGISVSPDFQFSFTDPNSANAVKFDLQVSTSSDFSSTIINEANYSTGGPWPSGSTITYTPSSSLGDNVSYYWRARVSSSNGWSYWPEPNYFTTGVNQAPNIPSVVSPSNGASGVAISPTLVFTCSDPDGNDCTKFDLQLDNNADFSSPLINVTNYTVGGPWTASSTISYTAGTELATSTTYYWKARIYDGSVWSGWSGGTGLNLANINGIESGLGHSCAVSNSGNIYCWGSNTYGELGNNSTTIQLTPVQVLGVGGSGYLTGVEDRTVGKFHSCALKSDGTVYCWGDNSTGQLGNNSTVTSTVPVQVLGVGGSGYLTGVSQMAAGNSHSCALKSDGTVYCWGYNSTGQLGNNSTTTQLTPVQVLGVGGSGYLTGVSQISSGNGHSCALKSDGTVYCWGKNSTGQLGNNSTTTQLTPVQVLGVGGSGYLTGVSQVFAGVYNSCALKSDGTVYCWGDNEWGQIGNNTDTASYVPVQVLGVGGSGYLTGVSQIAAGGIYHSCALKSDGTVYCWGCNYYGQLGNNSTDTESYTPVQVFDINGSSYLTGVEESTTGGYYSCALKSDGTVYCWGYNSEGQLGNNSTTDSLISVQTLKGSAQSSDTDASWSFTTYTNEPPALTSVSIDTSDAETCKIVGAEVVCASGKNITFNSSATDPDSTDLKLFVCKDSACSNCGPNATSSCWASSDASFSANPSAVYNSSSTPACASDAASNITTTADYIHSGSYAMKANVGMPEGYADVNFLTENGNTTVYGRTYLYIPEDFSWGEATYINILSFGDGDGNDRLDLGINKGTNIRLGYDYWDSYGDNHSMDSGMDLTKGAWHYIETKLVVDSSNGQVAIWVDGAQPVNISGLDTGDTNGDSFFGGTSWADGRFGGYIYEDDLAYGSAPIGQTPATGNLFNDGFEANDFSAWDMSAVSRCDSIDTQSDLVHSGDYALKFRVGLNNSQAEIDKITTGGKKTVYGRVYLYIPVGFDWGSASAINVMGFADDYGASRLTLSIENWGDPRLTWTYWDSSDNSHWNDAGDLSGVDFVEGKWINIEAKLVVSSSAGEAMIWVNDELSVSRTGLNTGTTNADRFYGASTWANTGFNDFLYEDDIAFGTEKIGAAPAQGNIFNDDFETNSLSLWDRVAAGAGSSYCGVGGCFFCPDKEFWAKVCDSGGSCSNIVGDSEEEVGGESGGGWMKIFSGSGFSYENAYSVQQTSDGGYILSGYTDGYGAGSNDFLITKLDSSGSLSWAKTLGGSSAESAWSVQQTSDGGYILAGYTTSYGAGSNDFLITKLDSSGSLSWAKTLGGSGSENTYSVQQTSDGGYIVAGDTDGYGAGSRDFLITKLDSSGSLSWAKTLGGSDYDSAWSIRQTSDGGYIMVGYTYTYGAGAKDILITKLDSSGSLSWAKTLGGSSADTAYSVQQTSDGGYIVAGDTDGYGAGSYDFLITKLDSSGSLSWAKTLGGVDGDRAYSVQQTSDGGYIVAGTTVSYGAGSADILITKLDSSGSLSWAKTLGESSYDYTYSIRQTSDGGYIVAGVEAYFDILVAKLDSSGNISGCAACQSVSPSVSSVSPSVSSPTPTVSSVTPSTSSPTPTVSSPSLTETSVCLAEECGSYTVQGAGGLTYGTVVGPDGKCWMDRNLGATQVATASDDSASYGYYYQWGRPTDGHQIGTSATTSVNSSSDIPGHANFITESSSPYDWRVPQSPNEATLWAGVNGGSNNPCPAGWHVPTSAEWTTVAGYFSPQDSDGAFNSTLKLPLSGYRPRAIASLNNQGDQSFYWSGSPSGTDAFYLYFHSEGVFPAATYDRANGMSVRCIKD